MIRLQERKMFRQLKFEQRFNEELFNPRLASTNLHLAVKTSQPQISNNYCKITMTQASERFNNAGVVLFQQIYRALFNPCAITSVFLSAN